jgi:hypothetical protein
MMRASAAAMSKFPACASAESCVSSAERNSRGQSIAGGGAGTARAAR